MSTKYKSELQGRHNGRDGVSNHQPHHCLLKHLFRRRSKKKSKLRVTDLCAENSPVSAEFPAQMANNAENVSIWWRHREIYVINQQKLMATSLAASLAVCISGFIVVWYLCNNVY